MPVLPLIDLLLLGGWTALFIGFVLKAISLTTHYPAAIFGLSSLDFLMVAVTAMLFSIALAARTWVKTQEPAARAERLKKQTMDAWNALPGHHDGGAALSEPALSEPEEVIANQANPAHRTG